MESKRILVEQSDELIVLPAAAKILGCDYRALVGFIDDDYSYEIEDDLKLGPQMDYLCKVAETYLDPKNVELFKKVKEVMEMVPGFKESIYEILLTNCVLELNEGSNFLSPEAFEAAMCLIKNDPDLQKRLDEETGDGGLMQVFNEFAQAVYQKRVIETMDSEKDVN